MKWLLADRPLERNMSRRVGRSIKIHINENAALMDGSSVLLFHPEDKTWEDIGNFEWDFTWSSWNERSMDAPLTYPSRITK